MSVFKRLSNVAKGKIKEIGRNLGELDPFGDDPDGDDPEAVPTGPPPRKAPADDKRAILDRLKADGLLTDEEYEAKLALLDEHASPEPGTGPRKPMKRNL